MRANKKPEEEKSPKFNASIQYLERIGRLINTRHQMVIDNLWDEVYLVTNELYNELYPRLNENQRKNSENLFKRCHILWKIRSRGSVGMDLNLYIMNLNHWFRDLNLFAHRQGLIMEDKATGEEATDV